jgi:hypothetical protein
MQTSTPGEERIANIARISGSKNEIAALRQHLKDVINGPAFQGSHRSGQFLKYIVEESLAGRFDSLKERVIGIELFRRDPSYDTSEDSIVRVTASDVRRRLLQHYGMHGVSSDIRISLPTGSYVPEFARELTGAVGQPDAVQDDKSSATLTNPPGPEHTKSGSSTLEYVDAPLPDRDLISKHSNSQSLRRWLAAGITFGLLTVISWSVLGHHLSHFSQTTPPVVPWSVFFSSPRLLHLITSDPNIFQIQELTGVQISVSDYANHNYISEPNKLSPEVRKLSDNILKGDKSASAFDPPIVAEIAALAQNSSKTIDVRAARNIQFSDLKNDDDFIFLGSPSSDPWSALFSDRLDFRFVFDKNSGQEIIRNVRPRQGELSAYLPTAPGWATGKSYSILAFIHNPEQVGHVLLIAGMNGEGTEAAGKLATDLPRLTAALHECGVAATSQTKEFEILLELNSLAGSPHQVTVSACHFLAEATR